MTSCVAELFPAGAEDPAVSTEAGASGSAEAMEADDQRDARVDDEETVYEA